MEGHAALRRVRAESAHSEARSEAGDEDRSLRVVGYEQGLLRTLRQDTTRKAAAVSLASPAPHMLPQAKPRLACKVRPVHVH